MGTDLEWEKWAVQDPYFSILTDPKFRTRALTPEARETFFASGRVHADQVMQTCRARLDPSFAPRRVLDFGCGVGRLLIPFAQAAHEVVGVDVSDAMLAQARLNLAEHGLANVSLVKSDDALSRVPGRFELVHSAIVLQHIEIPRGRELFRRLVGKVAPGGCGAIEIAFAWDAYPDSFGTVPPPPPPVPPPTGPLAAARAAIRTLRDRFGPPRQTDSTEIAPAPESADPEMQMNFYNMSELMFVLHAEGIESMHADFSNHGGAVEAFLYFRRPA